MGPRPPFMQRGPPGGHGGFHGPPRPPGPPGQRFQGPPPRGMGPMGGPRGPPPNLMQGYGDFPRQMRPHFSQEQNGGRGGDSLDSGGGWDMQGPPNQPNGGGMGYMGGPPQQGPPPNYGNVPPSHNQHYGNIPPQQPPPHAYGNGGPPGYGSGMPPAPGGYQQPPQSQQQSHPAQTAEIDVSTDEVWVETKAGDGKSYFYHAKSRETTWTKPEGPNIKVLTQQQVEAMAQQSAVLKPPENGMVMSTGPPQGGGYGSAPQQPFYPAHQGWNMGGAVAPTPAPALSAGPVPYPVMLGSDPGTDPVLLSQAMEWCEYRSPDGKPYYFNVKSSSSVWEKPQALRDYEVARLAAAARVHAGVPPSIPVIPIQPTMPEIAKKEEPKVTETEKPETVKETKDKEEIKAPKDKTRPVSSTPVPGTPWCVVWTGDGRVFFFNPSTRSSVWEKPEDLKNRPDVDKLIANIPDESPQQVDKKEEAKEIKPEKKKKSDSSVDEPPVKKSKSSDDVIEEIRIDEPTKDTAMEAEVKAAQQRAVIPLEDRIQQFKAMLAEKEVSAFSTWEKELHKIVFDSRYLLLTSKERKDVYEDFVRERVEEERREKRNRMKEKKDDFRRLMEDAKLNGKSTFSDFSHRYSKDERFRGVEKTRERESLFNEFIVEVRRKEKDERDANREKARKEFVSFLREQLGDQPSERYSRWTEVKRKLEDTKDSRLRNVDSSLREDYYREWIRAVREKMEKKEKEREKNKESKSSKRDKDREDRVKERKDSDRSRDRKDKDKDKDRSKDKDRKEKDRRKDKNKSKDGEKSKDKSKNKEKEKKRKVKSDSEEEEGETRDDVEMEENGDHDKAGSSDEVHAIEDDDDVDRDVADREAEEQEDSEAAAVAAAEEEEEEERERRTREKKAREEASLREREKEVQRALAPHLRDRDKERLAHQHGEAVSQFTALLTDLIRNPDMSWKEAKRTLRKDSRSEVTDILSKEEREKMFSEHIEKLTFKKRGKFRDMLEEIGELTLTTSWKKIRSLIKDDVRYAKFSSSDRKCEKEFNEFMKDKMVAAKADFRELLKESKFISYKSMKSVRESDQALKDIESTLRKDRRYLQLECVRHERQDLLMAHLEELERKGPPPPPTATEPVRRDKH